MSTALVKLPEKFPIPLTAGDLDSYIRTVSAIPVLSASEEQHFARELRHDNNLDAARKLILSQLRFVVHIARSYTGYGLPLADLIQEGNIGLMKAVKRFDPDMGVRLISFAVHWIRSEIHEYVIRNWRIVKVATTKAQRKLFFKLRATKKRLGWFNEQEARAVANDLKVEPETVLEMEARLNGQDTAFDMRAGEDNDQAVAPASYLQQENADPALLLEHQDESQRDQEQLKVALEGLDARSRDIVRRRWLDEAKPTLHELAAEYGVSAERIRQLEKNAMRKLRRHLED